MMTRLRQFALLSLILLIIGGLVYWVGTYAIVPNSTPRTLAPILRSPIPPLRVTPLVRFARIYPAIADVASHEPLNAVQNAAQPIGAYLPRTGNALFEFIAPTAFPTPLPYPTEAPLPFSPQAGFVLPTLAAGNVARHLPYAGEACAPGGNPVDGWLTQRFHAYHLGIDIAVPLGTPVIATHSGTVIYADWSELGYGYLVILSNGDFQTYYAHNMSFNVALGEMIGKGSILAWSGSTGNSSGPHVHYELRINDVPVDPFSFELQGYSSC